MTLAPPTSSSVVHCPACGGRFVVDSDLLGRGVDVVLVCTACGKGSVLGEVDRARAAQTANLVKDALRESTWPRVVVGHEVPAAARSVAHALRRSAFSPICVRSGDQVLAAADPTMPSPPAAVVLDVGIPGVLAFEIIEALRNGPATAHVPVVLLASVYEKTRYKRRPNRLYGADAYLELHHVPDRLAEVLRGLLGLAPLTDERVQAPVERARAAALRSDAAPADNADGARSLARRLLSDVALYHGDEIARGVHGGEPFKGVMDAIDAARDLHARAGGDRAIFDDEVRAFSARLGGAKGLGGRSVG